jgi:glycolate oxidase iron-sulfur subunit
MGPRGRIALLGAHASGQIQSSLSLNERIFSCTLCGACAGLCPPGIDIKEVIYHGRHLLKKTDKKRKYLRFITRFSAKRPKLTFRFLGLTQQILSPYLYKKGLLPLLPLFPDRALKDDLHVYTVSKKRGRVAVYTGCGTNFLFPHLGESLIRVLHGLGYEVILPAGEVCCGTPLRALGLEEEAVELAKKNVGVFNRLNVDAVLSLCPTCTLALTVDYPKLIGDGIGNAMDITQFLIDKLDMHCLTSFADCKKAVYHDPCHLKYGLGIVREPREIIRNSGLEIVNTPGERCCGFAGTFCFSYKDISRRLLQNCVADYAASGADMVVTSCPGCMLQLSKEILDKPVVHIIEVIEDALLQQA